MRRRLALAAAACLSIPAHAHARAPSQELNDDLLAHLQGNWQLKRQIRGIEVDNTVTARWVLHHQFLELHMQDVQVPATYEAPVLIGYIPTTNKYVAHWTDTFGGAYSALGEGVRTGNSIALRFAYDDGPSSIPSTGCPTRAAG